MVCIFTVYIFYDNSKVILSGTVVTIAFDSDIFAASVEPVCFLVKCYIMTTPVRGAGCWAMFFGTVPSATSAGASVTIVGDFSPRHIELAIMLTWAVSFFHTRALSIIKEAIGTQATGFTLCGATFVVVQV